MSKAIKAKSDERYLKIGRSMCTTQFVPDIHWFKFDNIFLSFHKLDLADRADVWGHKEYRERQLLMREVERYLKKVKNSRKPQRQKRRG